MRVGVDVVIKKGLRLFFVKWPGMATEGDFLDDYKEIKKMKSFGSEVRPPDELGAKNAFFQ